MQKHAPAHPDTDDDRRSAYRRFIEAANRRLAAYEHQARGRTANNEEDGSWIPATVRESSRRIALVVRGYCSSADDTRLDKIAYLFRRTHDVLYFNYLGHDANTPYTRADAMWPNISSMRQLAERLQAYFTRYPMARFDLICHSFGGMILAYTLDRAKATAFYERINRVYLLASPIHMDAGLLPDLPASGRRRSGIWTLLDDYNVIIGDLPRLNRLVSIHCVDGHDELAFYDDTCLREYEQNAFGNSCREVDNDCDHFTILDSACAISIISSVLNKDLGWRSFMGTLVAWIRFWGKGQQHQRKGQV